MIENFFSFSVSFSSILLSTIDSFKVFSYNKVITLIQSPNLVYLIFNCEKYRFVINVLILDKNEIQLAHIFPTGANPDTVNPLTNPNPTDPNKISETIINTFFLFKLLYFL